ncbi:hypothetical protein CCR97_08380 [Rhodoplanes elegans]|uniref:Uncharacterized protein n=1 Tax=Rhodoplanes elegans TaxID=29408 RepID=A0A327KPV1_9BRAD|nr:hypothetical protein [Rhodoplanes elegans]MBK5958134.1 hypothetical protein [Rhodoplanes elegans]MBK5958226.1 hypothetical protein [Rhodoplanes elegans]RAI40421.1 hypothetical protein CH338_06155 [Rhodoplanes elegans]
MSEVCDMRHAKLMQELRQSGVTIEDIARAWASIDGKRDAFDAEKGKSVSDDITGHYLGYLSEAEELVTRAAKYARERR